MIIERIAAMLQECEGENPLFPPTHLFNENWLLRLVLDWFARRGVTGDLHPLAPMPEAQWFSEAWLPSAFLPRQRGDRLAESWTHADGVIGHFTTGNRGWADLALLPGARQFVAIEAKIFSRLSAGVKNAPYYDQAARTVACMAEALRRAGRHPAELEVLSFVLVAPRRRIEEGVFAEEMKCGSIQRKVRRRVEDYVGAHDAWFGDWFVPTARRIDLKCLAWEEVLDAIAFYDPPAGHELDAYYGKCLRFNRPQAVTVWLDPGAAPPCVAEVVPREEAART